jgi:flagellum-specific ATP synthase
MLDPHAGAPAKTSPADPVSAQRSGLGALTRFEERLASAKRKLPLTRVSGAVTHVAMSHYRVSGLSRFLRLGDCLSIEADERTQLGEVVKLDAMSATVKPFDAICEATIGARAFRAEAPSIWPCEAWKGRVIDALGRPIDGLGALPTGAAAMPFDAESPAAMRRSRVKTPIRTGVRVIDFFTPLCAGQRIGVFAGSGVGKSSLLAMLAKAPDFDVTVIALVGERGREVREFIEDTLGESRGSTVAVVSTGDESPMMRRLAPKAAMSVAEYFRDRGSAVLLIVDSVTRFAHAARDVALAAGEPPVARGYAPSVFSDLPKLLERAGPGVEGTGSITGIFSVLIDGDDHNDPVADSVRGTLDGHIVLDRAIADQGRYPAINILASVSRLAGTIWTSKQAALTAKLRNLVARYEETRDLRLIGGYVAGTDPALDQAVKLVPRLYEAMAQSPSANPSLDAIGELAAALQAEPATRAEPDFAPN